MLTGTCMGLLDKDTLGERYLKTHKNKGNLCDSLLQALYILRKIFSDIVVSRVVYNQV